MQRKPMTVQFVGIKLGEPYDSIIAKGNSCSRGQGKVRSLRIARMTFMLQAVAMKRIYLCVSRAVPSG